uniref:Ribosome production factor 2 homolog n=1 Tax=Panagrellus redivivus TaxID=6233 RepID=A0A7E4V8S7_PANRE
MRSPTFAPQLKLKVSVSRDIQYSSFYHLAISDKSLNSNAAPMTTSLPSRPTPRAVIYESVTFEVFGEAITPIYQKTADSIATKRARGTVKISPLFFTLTNVTNTIIFYESDDCWKRFVLKPEVILCFSCHIGPTFVHSLKQRIEAAPRKIVLRRCRITENASILQLLKVFPTLKEVHIDRILLVSLLTQLMEIKEANELNMVVVRGPAIIFTEGVTKGLLSSLFGNTALTENFGLFIQIAGTEEPWRAIKWPFMRLFKGHFVGVDSRPEEGRFICICYKSGKRYYQYCDSEDSLSRPIKRKVETVISRPNLPDSPKRVRVNINDSQKEESQIPAKKASKKGPKPRRNNKKRKAK